MSLSIIVDFFDGNKKNLLSIFVNLNKQKFLCASHSRKKLKMTSHLYIHILEKIHCQKAHTRSLGTRRRGSDNILSCTIWN